MRRAWRAPPSRAFRHQIHQRPHGALAHAAESAAHDWLSGLTLLNAGHRSRPVRFRRCTCHIWLPSSFVLTSCLAAPAVLNITSLASESAATGLRRSKTLRALSTSSLWSAVCPVLRRLPRGLLRHVKIIREAVVAEKRPRDLGGLESSVCEWLMKVLTPNEIYLTR